MQPKDEICTSTDETHHEHSGTRAGEFSYDPRLRCACHLPARATSSSDHHGADPKRSQSAAELGTLLHRHLNPQLTDEGLRHLVEFLRTGSRPF